MVFDESAERHVLGGMLEGGAADALGVLTAQSFYFDKHGLIFSAIGNLFAQKKPFDLVTVKAELEQMGKLSQAGGEKLLMEISSEVVTSANVQEHARIVLDRFKRRSIAKLLLEAGNIENLSIPVGEVVGELEKGLSDISATGEVRGLRPIRDSIESAFEGWQGIIEGKNTGFKTGLAEVDQYLGGLQPGRMTVIASPPGIGKSALALQIAINSGAKTAFYPLEMLEEELMERAIANGGRVNGDAFMEKLSLEKYGPMISLEIARLKDLPIQLCDDATITPLRLSSQVHRMKQKEGCDLVVVDYLQLMEADGKHEGRTQEVGSVSKALKRLAKAENVHVIAVASLSTKETERRPDKRGMLSDLRQNGDIGYDAHSVIFLYRESEYNPKAYKSETLRDITEVIFRKNRGRKRGTGLLAFDGPHFRFMDLDHQFKRSYLDFLEGKLTSEDF